MNSLCPELSALAGKRPRALTLWSLPVVQEGSVWNPTGSRLAR